MSASKSPEVVVVEVTMPTKLLQIRRSSKNYQNLGSRDLKTLKQPKTRMRKRKEKKLRPEHQEDPRS
jgi:hypothetical protein